MCIVSTYDDSRNSRIPFRYLSFPLPNKPSTILLYIVQLRNMSTHPLASSPRPFPVFQCCMLKNVKVIFWVYTTLKNWEWPGDETTHIDIVLGKVWLHHALAKYHIFELVGCTLISAQRSFGKVWCTYLIIIAPYFMHAL